MINNCSRSEVMATAETPTCDKLAIPTVEESCPIFMEYETIAPECPADICPETTSQSIQDDIIYKNGKKPEAIILIFEDYIGGHGLEESPC